MTDMSDDELRARLARLDPAPAGSPVDPVTSPRAQELVERAMSTPETQTVPNPDPADELAARRRRPWLIPAAAAAAVLAAVVATVLVISGGGATPAGNGATEARRRSPSLWRRRTWPTPASCSTSRTSPRCRSRWRGR